MKYLLFLVFAALMTGCHYLMGEDGTAADVAERWAEAYFRCDYHEAEKLCTPESWRWLQFAASNTTQHDLDLIGERVVKVEFDDFFPQRNDTMMTVRLRVSHYLKPAAIGLKSTLGEDGVFDIVVVKRHDQWMVRMEGLPRSGRQSRDAGSDE